jgi:hypothetical protein
MSPAPTMRPVAFGRLNRRLPDQQSFARRPFAEDMRALAESRQTRAEIDEREWVAADLTLDISGDFMTGVLGYAESELRRDFEDDAWPFPTYRHHKFRSAGGAKTAPLQSRRLPGLIRHGRQWIRRTRESGRRRPVAVAWALPAGVGA